MYLIGRLAHGAYSNPSSGLSGTFSLSGSQPSVPNPKPEAWFRLRFPESPGLPSGLHSTHKLQMLRRCLVSSLPGTAPEMQPALNKYLIIECIMFTILQETVVRFRSCMPEELLVPSLRLEERRHTSHFVPGVPSSPCPVDKGVS